MPISDATIRDLQYMLDDRTPIGRPEKAVAEALLELLDRVGLTDTSTGRRTLRTADPGG